MRTMLWWATAFVLSGSLSVGAVVTAMAQDEGPAFEAPSEFSGRVLCGPQIEWGTVDPVMTPMGEYQMTRKETRGDTWQPTIEAMTDPRLVGQVTSSWASDEYFVPGMDEQPIVVAVTERIENEDGAWRGSFRMFGLPDFGTSRYVVEFIGEGDYGGLTAIAEYSPLMDECGWDVRGMVIDGELPPIPELPAKE